MVNEKASVMLHLTFKFISLDLISDLLVVLYVL